MPLKKKNRARERVSSWRCAKKKEKEKKKNFGASARKMAAMRREVRAPARRHGCMRLFHVCDRQKAGQRTCQHEDEKAAGKRTRPAFGRAIGRPAPVLSADLLVFLPIPRFRGSGARAADRRRSTHANAFRTGYSDAGNVGGASPPTPPLKPPAPVRARRRAIPRARSNQIVA